MWFVALALPHTAEVIRMYQHVSLILCAFARTLLSNLSRAELCKDTQRTVGHSSDSATLSTFDFLTCGNCP
jgi:hypothetical protein